jgi:hypothetical protein
MSLIGEKTRKNDVFELRLTFRFDNLRGAAQMQRQELASEICTGR